MCGIAGVYRRTDRPIPQLDYFMDLLLVGIEHRGEDATGYVTMTDDGSVQLQKASCKASKFMEDRKDAPEDARSVLLHTRFATQGSPAFPENNHPLTVAGIYAVHNGHINNDNALFAKSGKERQGQVDSECIPAAVARREWSPEGVSKAMETLDGHAAVALTNVRHPRDLVLARANSSPLVYIVTERLIVWASTENAIRNAWKRAFGTPPSKERFRFAKEGDLIWISNGAVTVHGFEPKEPRRYYGGSYDGLGMGAYGGSHGERAFGSAVDKIEGYRFTDISTGDVTIYKSDGTTVIIGAEYVAGERADTGEAYGWAREANDEMNAAVKAVLKAGGEEFEEENLDDDDEDKIADCADCGATEWRDLLNEAPFGDLLCDNCMDWAKVKGMIPS